MQYNLYVIATGLLLSSSANPITNTDPLRDVNQTTAIGIWNPATLDFDPYPPSPILSSGDFFDRFTQPELESLIRKARNSDGPAVFLKRLDLKESVDLTDPLLEVDMLRMVAAGVLTVARKQEIMTIV